MKKQVTRKWVNESFDNVIQMPYQQRFDNLNPNWYTCGVYGWNADIYMLDIDTVLVVGYRPFGIKFKNLPKNYQSHVLKLINDKMGD